MVKLFVCQVCGEPYIGGGAPDDCPFCGAQKKFIRPFEEYSQLWDTPLSEQEKTDVKATLDLEVNATAYYDKIAKGQPRYSRYNRFYKQLARTELEHAEIAAKTLKVPLPEIKGEDSKGSIPKDLERTRELENHATELYKQFLKNAKNEKVKMFFTALIHAEEGHYNIAGNELKRKK
jgi:rubrerythrin